MNIKTITNKNKEKFVLFCKKHRKNLDDSFLYDEDLDDFEINEENPTYAICNDDDKIIAVVSLIIDNYFKKAKAARLRIFYSEINNINYYSALLNLILNHTIELDKIYLYVPMDNNDLLSSISSLGFKITRYSYVLVRDSNDIPSYVLPDNYSIKTFENGDEDIWCNIRNICFSSIKGSETAITTDDVKKMVTSNYNIESGMMILYHNEKAVGIIRGSNDVFEDSPILNIGPLAILPEYQKKGLGRGLIRTMLNFAVKNSYNKTILSVNAENEKAKSLYLKEGFALVESLACFELEVY